MPKIKFAFALAAILLVSWSAIQAGLLRAQSDEPLYIVIVDRHATSMSQENRDLAVSFIGLLSALREERSIGFLTADEEAVIGPAVSGSAEHKSAYREVISGIEDSSSVSASDLSASLSYAHEVMKFEGAGEGSAVFVISGGDMDGAAPAEASPLGETISAFNRENWQVVSVALPGSSTYAKDFMRTVSGGTGGDVFPLSTPQELKSIADSILSVDARGTLFEIGQDSLAPNDVFSASLDIAPSTTESSLVFFKQGAAGSMSLQNPSGIEASDGDRALSGVVETPHVVVWRLSDPAPGDWTVDVRGGDGFVSAWHYPKNKLDLHLVSFDTIPHDRSTEIVVYVSDGEERVSVPDGEIRATVIDSAGQALTHPLNDRGELGDAVAGDAYYSTTIPPLNAEGDYKVELELYWPEYDHSISTGKSVTAMAFPALDVNIEHADALVTGKRVVVGGVEVKVNGQPYGIPVRQLSADISSASSSGVVELMPRADGWLNTEHAWAFDIVFTPADEERHTLLLTLDMNYAGREYRFTTDSVILSSVVPPPVPAQQHQVIYVDREVQVEVPVRVEVAAPPVVAPPAPEGEGDGGSYVMVIAYGIAGAAVVLAIAAAIYSAYGLSKPSPYGYLYDDEGNLLADFSSIERSFLTLVTSKNLLRGRELDVPELRGLSFFFKDGNVDIRSGQTEPSIRVNNRPLVNGQETRSLNQSWIGTQGKLYSLYLAKPEQDPEPLVAPAPTVGDD